MSRATVTCHNTTSYRIDTALVRSIVGAALPSGYALSLVLCADGRSRRLNSVYRNKDYATDVLSFPLTASEGEIYLNVRKALKDAPQYNHSPEGHVYFLLIHGCLHLKGYSHGSTMESRENSLCRRFNIR